MDSLVKNLGASPFLVRAKSMREVVYNADLRQESTAVRTMKFMMVPTAGMPITSSVGGGLAQVRVGEVVLVHPHRVPGPGAPGLPTVDERADEFLFLGADTDDRLPRR